MIGRLSAALLVMLLVGSSAPGAPADAAGFLRVAPGGAGFVRGSGAEARPFVPYGVNYDHDESARLIEEYWDAEWTRIEADFAEIKELGANVVRVHLQVAKFLNGPTEPNEAALERLGRLVALAEKLGLTLDVTGLGCYRRKDVPAWYDALDEAGRWAAQVVFWKAVAGRCKDSPAIFCYDLMNEPVVTGGTRKPGEWLGGEFAGFCFVQFITLDQKGRPRPEIARAWVETLAKAVRSVDPNHMVTVGMVDWSLDRPGLTSGFVPSVVAGPLDFVCVHLYPRRGKLDEAFATLDGFNQGVDGRKPVVIEETFLLNCGADEMRTFFRRSRDEGKARGWIGFYWGKSAAEMTPPKSIGDAITVEWLKLFRDMAPAMTVPLDPARDAKPRDEPKPATAPAAAPSGRSPNVVILYADDLGYGDLGCYGHPTIRTPNLDRMAAEGLKFTQYYSSAPVCTPSRAALLTGRLPLRSGLTRVLFPQSEGGLPASEITLAEALKAKGYDTACVGKWHLGHLPKYLPTRHGFDQYLGIPYSNDMTVNNDKRHDPPLPLLRDEAIVEQPVEQATLTPRYTDEAVRIIAAHARGGARSGTPFFLYLPYTFPHIPLFASPAQKGKSPRGLYGDAVEEIDASAGRILAAVRDGGLASETLVVFTSDNGPWLIQRLQGGSAGLLREGKGSTWEGGMREPCLAWWPGTIAPGRVSADLAAAPDWFATALDLAGAPLPADRPIDGVSLVPLLKGTGPGARTVVPYFHGETLAAVRQGPWKLHLVTNDAGAPTAERRKAVMHDPPLLFHLERDPSEQFDVARDHPDVVARLRREIERLRREVVAGPPQR